MDVQKVDAATEILEDTRRLLQKMQSSDFELLKSREFSLAITQIETGKLWLLEVAAQAQR